jgi:hypothetical protein
VDNLGTVLGVVLGGDPAGSEGAERGEGRSTLPDGVLAVGGSNNTDLGAGGSESGDLRLEALSEAVVHGGSTGKNNVLAEFLADIDVGGRDGVPGELMHGGARLSVEVGLEEELGAGHTGVGVDGNDALVRHGVGFVVLGGVLGLGVLGFVVGGDIAELFFNITNNFELGGGGKRLSGIEEELLHESGEETASDFHLLNGVRNGETLEDGDGVSNTIAGIADETGSAASGVEGEDGLNRYIHVLNLESFEHDGGHLLAVLLGVTGSLSHEDTEALLRGNAELVVEGVVPDALHIFPGVDDTVSDGVLEVEDTLLLHGFVTDVLVLLVNTVHGGSVLWASNDGGENSARSLLAGETSLNHAGSVVNNNSVLVSHLSICLRKFFV